MYFDVTFDICKLSDTGYVEGHFSSADFVFVEVNLARFGHGVEYLKAAKEVDEGAIIFRGKKYFNHDNDVVDGLLKEEAMSLVTVSAAAGDDGYFQIVCDLCDDDLSSVNQFIDRSLRNHFTKIKLRAENDFFYERGEDTGLDGQYFSSPSLTSMRNLHD